MQATALNAMISFSAFEQSNMKLVRYEMTVGLILHGLIQLLEISTLHPHFELLQNGRSQSKAQGCHEWATEWKRYWFKEHGYLPNSPFESGNRQTKLKSGAVPIVSVSQLLIFCSYQQSVPQQLSECNGTQIK